MERGYGDCHHIVPRKRGLHVRWKLNNLILLCSKCHFWFHSDPFSMEWFQENDPDAYEIVKELNQHQTESYKQADLLEWVETLESMLKAVE